MNPKEYLHIQRTNSAESYYSYHHRIYFIVINRIYIIELDAATDKSIAIPLRDNYFFDKIVSYDHGNRLLIVTSPCKSEISRKAFTRDNSAAAHPL